MSANAFFSAAMSAWAEASIFAFNSCYCCTILASLILYRALLIRSYAFFCFSTLFAKFYFANNSYSAFILAAFYSALRYPSCISLAFYSRHFFASASRFLTNFCFKALLSLASSMAFFFSIMRFFFLASAAFFAVISLSILSVYALYSSSFFLASSAYFSFNFSSSILFCLYSTISLANYAACLLLRSFSSCFFDCSFILFISAFASFSRFFLRFSKNFFFFIP